jgi:hypothetical protein
MLGCIIDLRLKTLQNNAFPKKNTSSIHPKPSAPKIA